MISMITAQVRFNNRLMCNDRINQYASSYDAETIIAK